MKQDPRYTDLMQEIKERLYTIEEVLSGRAVLHGPLANEFCFLQLRIICECIAYACVIAHAYIKEIQVPKFQKEWSANELMKQLSGLHQDFYPKPKTMTVTNGSVQLGEIDAPYLTKSNLQKLYGICNAKLHRGSAEKYAFSPTQDRLAADRQTIINYANEVFRLMELHLMTNRDAAQYILCQFRERGVPVQVAFAAAGNEVATCAQVPMSHE